jgi:signal transduction histidine kinase/ActR/RegA family two-component response regulator
VAAYIALPVDTASFDSVDRLEIERHLQKVRLGMLASPVLLVAARGPEALPYALLIAGGIMLSFGIVALLLRGSPAALTRHQLLLRLVDCAIVSVILAGVYRIERDTHLDFVYLILVVAAAATHAGRGVLIVAAAGGLAILAGRFELALSGAASFGAGDLIVALTYTLFFVVTGSVLTLLMRKSGEAVGRREQQWRDEWVRREADRQALGEYERLLDRLTELAQALGGGRDRLAAFRSLRDFVLASTPSHGLYVSLYDAERDERRCAYGFSEGQELDVALLPPLPMSESPNSRAIRTGEVVICDDFQSAIKGQPHVDTAVEVDPRPPRSSLVAPLKVMGRVVGAFEVQSPLPAAYTREHATALGLAANLAAFAIENVDHLERERELRVAAEASEHEHRALAEQRKRLIEMSQAALATLSIDEVICRVLAAIRDLVPINFGAVYWVDGSSRLLRPALVVGDEAFTEPMRTWEIPLGVGIVGEVVRTGRAALANNAHEDPRSVYPPGAAVATDHFVCLPLSGKEGTVGVVMAVRGSDPPFGQDEFELLQLFVTHAGLAIENARLFEQARALAQTEKLRALGQMAGGVAHDLNQSLALIAGYCDLALTRLDQTPSDAAGLRETLGIVAQAAMNGGKTVNGLLTFARSQPDGAPEPVDLAGLLGEVAQLTAPRWRDAAQAEGRPIEVIVGAEGDLLVYGWSASLKAAFTNLIFNAIDAMPRGGRVRLDARRRGHELLVEVADTGVGMSPDVQARVFEPFFSTKGESGTGLGLAMVYGVVQQHGGRVSVRSAVGEGTAFRLVFPAGDRTAETARPTEAPVELRAAAPSKVMRVLVVDDEPQLTRVAALILGQQGHEVATASSGEEALALFEREPFDAVISDVSMGAGINGWELARRVRDLRPETRVVLATGYGAAIDPAEARRRGVDLIVAKPYRAGTLRDALVRADHSAELAVAALAS